MGSLVYGILFAVVLTFAFEGALYGQDLIESSYPAFYSVDFGSCGGDGALDDIACYIGNAWNAFLNFLLFIFGTIILAFNLITFNIPGSPPLVRFILTGIVGGTVLIFVAVAIIRGGSSEG